MRCFALILLIFCSYLTTASADAFADALALEKQGKHLEAAASYEVILKQKPASSSALFNLGNCYFAEKNYGKAILAYERALSINPRSADVKKNLALTRKAAFPNEAIDSPTGLYFLLSRSEWTLLIVITAWLIGTCSICATFFPSIRKSALLVAAISLVPIVVASLALQHRRSDSQRAIVTAPSSKLLLSPFPSAEEVSPCPPGMLILIEQSQTAFTYVRLASTNTAGWIQTKSIEQIEQP